MVTIQVKREKQASIFRKHPWIFSGALLPIDEKIEEGALVSFTDNKETQLGFGHYSSGSIAVRVLSFGPNPYDSTFWERKLKQAWDHRVTIGLASNSMTNCFRWVHAEGDELPGLIIDVYNNTAVIQCHSIGMYKNIQDIVKAIKKLGSGIIKHIINKSKETLPNAFATTIENEIIVGESSICTIIENGISFQVDVMDSQKTGLFLDQRENRKLLAQYAKNKKVLNAFCYTGGFSIYALSGGAKEVFSIDISQKAIDVLHQNLIINNVESISGHHIKQDAIVFLNQMEKDEFDIIILDPPAFAKSLDKRHNAIQAYKRINLAAMKKIKCGGILFTFSCSQVVTEDLFYHTIVSAGIESGRNIKVLHKLTQGPDHPVNLFHPEGSYLKGLVLFIE